LQDLPKFTQIWIFGLKIYHLATLRAPVGEEKNKLNQLNCRVAKMPNCRQNLFELLQFGKRIPSSGARARNQIKIEKKKGANRSNY
jgi:hypothetical protein